MATNDTATTATFNSGERRYDRNVLSTQYHQKTSSEKPILVLTTDQFGSRIPRESRYADIPPSIAMPRRIRPRMWFGFMSDDWSEGARSDAPGALFGCSCVLT